MPRRETDLLKRVGHVTIEITANRNTSTCSVAAYIVMYDNTTRPRKRLAEKLVSFESDWWDESDGTPDELMELVLPDIFPTLLDNLTVDEVHSLIYRNCDSSGTSHQCGCCLPCYARKQVRDQLGTNEYDRSAAAALKSARKLAKSIESHKLQLIAA